MSYAVQRLAVLQRLRLHLVKCDCEPVVKDWASWDASHQPATHSGNFQDFAKHNNITAESELAQNADSKKADDAGAKSDKMENDPTASEQDKVRAHETSAHLHYAASQTANTDTQKQYHTLRTTYFSNLADTHRDPCGAGLG